MKTGAYQCLDCGVLANLNGERLCVGQVNPSPCMLEIALKRASSPIKCHYANLHRWKRVGNLRKDQ